MINLRSVRLLVTSLSLFLVAATCSGDNTGPEETHVGVYTLIRANNLTLPAIVLQEGNVKEEAVSGTLAITAEGTWAAVLTSRRTEGTSVTTISDSPLGSYTISGNTLTLIGGDEPTPATWDGDDRITVEVENGNDVNMTLLFEK